MKTVLRDEDLRERATIDGRVAFSVAAFASAAVLVALLDRVGVPEPVVGVLGPLFSIAGLIWLGMLMRSMRISRFYAAGRALPSSYAGLTLASLATGLCIPFVPPVPPGVGFGTLAWGVGIGLVLVALVSGPLVRKTGAFSLTDLLAARFPNLSLRLALVVVVAVTSLLIALAAYQTAALEISHALGIQRPTAMLLTGFVIAAMILPGGTGGVVWSGAGAAGLLIAGFAMPLVLMMFAGTPLPAPVFGDAPAWSEAVSRIAGWTGHPVTLSDPVHWLVIGVIALGVSALAPLLAPAIGCSRLGSAQRAGVASIVWVVVIAVLIGATVAVSTLALGTSLEGLRPESLPGFIYQSSGRGLIAICGKAVADPAAARAACAALAGFKGQIRPADISTTGDFLMLAAPMLRGFGVALSGLVAAGVIAVSLVLTASSIQCIAVAIGHDALYRVRDASALTSHRLAATRGVQIITIIAMGALLYGHAADARTLIGLAIAFSAATFVPLLVLTLWPRATGIDATLALLVSLATAEAVIMFGSPQPQIVQLAMAAGAGCALGLAVGIATSFLRAKDPTSPGGIFVTRLLHGQADVLNPDKAT